MKIPDHCHYTGKVLDYAHDQCNLKRQSINYIPVIAHNSSNYDIHHLSKKSHEFESECKIVLVPVTNEKDITVNNGVRVNSCTDKRGVVNNVYEYLRFIDSNRFLPSSLEKLVSCLPTESFRKLIRQLLSKISADRKKAFTSEKILSLQLSRFFRDVPRKLTSRYKILEHQS